MLTWKDVEFLERMAEAHRKAGLPSNAEAFQDLADRITAILTAERSATLLQHKD